jgi:hypothetical protein
MNKIALAVLTVLLLVSCKKDKKETDRYEGEFYIQFSVNNETLSVNKTTDQLSYTASPQKWKIDKLDNNKYIISPASELNIILANNGALSPVLIARPDSIISPEIFSFDTLSNGLVNIKSAGDNRYLVFQYGLNISGNIGILEFWI